MALFGDSERIGVVAQIRARSGHENDVREALQSLVGPSRKENGCLRDENEDNDEYADDE